MFGFGPFSCAARRIRIACALMVVADGNVCPTEQSRCVTAMKSLQGQFLIASPELGDPNFYKGVVLMIKHDEEGAFGLILNRPTDNTVAEVWKMVGEEDVDCPKPIFMGGPV